MIGNKYNYCVQIKKSSYYVLVKRFSNLVRDERKKSEKLIDKKLFNLDKTLSQKINNCSIN